MDMNSDISLSAKSTAEQPQPHEWAHFHHLLGPLKGLMEDSFVTNIEVNEDGTVFYEKFGEGSNELPQRMTKDQRAALIGFLANNQSGNAGRGVDSLRSSLGADMEPYYDARIQAFAPPISFWTIVIRKFNHEIFTFDRYVEKGEMTRNHRNYFRDVVIPQKMSLFIFGKPDAGKNTFLNGYNQEVADVRPKDRIVILQDRNETKCPSRNKLFIKVRVEQEHVNGDRWIYDFQDAIAEGLRSNPGRMIIQEFRDGIAVRAALMATNLGLDGMVATGHSNGAEDGLLRIEDLMRMENLTPVPRMIARFCNVIGFMEKDEHGRRRLTQVSRLNGVDRDGKYQLDPIAA